VALRRAYGLTMILNGFQQLRTNREEESVKSFEAARAAYRSIDDLALTDLPSAAGYAEASSWQVEACSRRPYRRGAQGRRRGDRRRRQTPRCRPGTCRRWRSRGLMNSSLASAEEDGLVIRKALVHSLAAEQDWRPS
jgi:hypothetical protein